MFGALKILLVEDQPDDAELIERALIRGGLTVEIMRVETGPEMQAALSSRSWDLVLSDFNLPLFSAEKALAVLQDSGHDLPFIILSGEVRSDNAVALLRRGAHDFLNKDSLARLVPAILRELREAQERAKRRIAESRVRILSQAIEQSPVSVAITDPDGIIEYVNPKFCETSGFSFVESVGRPLIFTAQADTAPEVFEDMWGCVRSGQEWRGEFSNRRGEDCYWEHVTVSPLTGAGGEVTNFIAVKEDVTLRRDYEERLLRQANFDHLTGLPNRTLMFDRLSQAIAQAARIGGKVGVLYLDMDRFKQVNDSMGHAFGDAVVGETAQRLAPTVRDGDTLARVGGDDFVFILQGIEDGQSARLVADRARDIIHQPMHIRGRELVFGCSVGIALYPGDGHDAHTLLKNAELAMHRAKDMGGNRNSFFTRELDQRVQVRMEIESQLRGVELRGETSLHYQPIVDLRTGKAVGVEALIRWMHPDAGLRLPGDFIPVAEESGLINPLGRWVLSTAAKELRHLHKVMGDHLRVAVNVSPVQLREADFAPFVERILAAHDLGARHLELEITESVVMDDCPETAANLSHLADMGIRLSMDDFGTGYSSLGYLRRYAFSTLKIDRSFVSRASRNRGDGRLVETIIAMAHALGLDVIAEGVENQDQAEFLALRDCDQVQGWLFGRPRCLEDLMGESVILA